jgi:hypothetical protein
MSQIPGIKINDLIAEAIKLRKTLHRYPEVSGQERQTAGWIKAFLEKYRPDQVIEGIGGHSMAAIFDSQKEGPTLMLRADMDALPILESMTFRIKVNMKVSLINVVTTVILPSWQPFLQWQPKTDHQKAGWCCCSRPKKKQGKVLRRLSKTRNFRTSDRIIFFPFTTCPALKNIRVIIKDQAFASASKGVIIRLQGSSSHAAHPEKGNSPGPMLPELIDGLLKIPKTNQIFKILHLSRLYMCIWERLRLAPTLAMVW